MSAGEERTGYGSFERRPDEEPEDEGSGDAMGERARGSEQPGRSDTIDGPPCDICGYPMLDRHCKLICLHCGFTRDCSDP